MYKEYIWNYFVGKIGNEYGVAGLMGNLQAESALRPNNLQDSYQSALGYNDNTYTVAVDEGTYTRDDFVYDEAGYGLAQWTYWSRKANLYDFWKNGGYSSIGDIELACDFLYFELQTVYPGVLEVLETASSIREASNMVLHGFENPANQSVSVENYRASLGVAIYQELTGTTPPTPTTPVKAHKMSLLMLLLATKRK